MRKKKNNCFDYCIEIECNNLKITEVYNTRIFALQKLAPFKKFTWHICMSKHIILYFDDVMAQNNWRTFQRGIRYLPNTNTSSHYSVIARNRNSSKYII